MARKTPGRPAPDDELKAVERTGAHDQPPASLFGSEAILGTAELAMADVDLASTLAADPPAGLFDIPDPEDDPIPQPIVLKKETRRERFGSISDPEGPPMRSIPLPESDPPMDALELDTRADEIPRAIEDAGTGVVDIPAPPPRPAAPMRRPPPIPRSAPPVPMPVFESSAPPAARSEVPSDPPEPSEPSVVLDDPGFGREESTRVFDRQAPAPGPVLPRGRLVVVQGEQQGKAWYLNRPLTYLGRGNDNDIVVLDIAASRKHLRLDRHAEGFRVQDLQSGNGTLLNGRRISREELYDGDRIEVGSHVLEFTSLGTPRVRPRDTGRATDPGIVVRPATPAPAPAVPRTWIIVWSLATFLAVFGAMYLTRMLRQGRREAPAVAEPVVVEADGEVHTTARRHLGVAREAMGRRAWAEARSALDAARSTGSQLPEITQEWARLATEEKAALALQLAGAHRASGQHAAARAALAEVPLDSVYAGEARALAAELDAAAPPSAAPLSAPPSAAPASAPPAPPITAPPTAAPPSAALLRAPPTAAPASAAPVSAPPARTPRREAPASAARAAPASRAPRARAAAPSEAPAPPAADDGQDHFPQATAAYKGRRFAEAAAAFERAAKSGPADRRAQAAAKAQAVRTVADALAQVDAAEAAGRRGEAAAALEQALAADRTLGGALASGLRPALARFLVYEALRDFSARKYVEAARKNHRALNLDPRLSQAQDLARKLEAQATLILQRARDADGDERRRFAEQARQLVPANSTLARDADDLIKGE